MGTFGSSKSSKSTISTSIDNRQDNRQTDNKIAADNSNVVATAGGANQAGAIVGGAGAISISSTTDHDSVALGAGIARDALNTVAANSREISLLGQSAVGSIAAAASGQAIPTRSSPATPVAIAVVVAVIGVGVLLYLKGKK